MPIFDQGYQHWQGKLSGHAWRWSTITRQGVRTQLRSRWVRGLILISWVPALLLAFFMVCWGLAEQKAYAGVRDLLVNMFELPRDIVTSPKSYRSPVWTIAYEIYFQVQLWFCLGVVMIIGPGLISQDLRFNAIPLYFSKPLRRLDYFVGKLGVIAYTLAMVAVVPALFAYLLGVCFSLDLRIVPDTFHVLAASLGYGALIVVSAGTLMLAFSSLSRNSRYVGIIWAGFCLVSVVFGAVLKDAVREDWCGIVSYKDNLERLGNRLLQSKEAHERVMPTVAGVSPAPAASGPAVMPAPSAKGVQVKGKKGRPPPQPPPPMATRSGRSPGRSTEIDPPWYWSAGVLAGLFGLSLCILTTRVKSLDRLR
jgi:ABC-2 type transport system permease protein